jgi:hypothetical protein
VACIRAVAASGAPSLERFARNRSGRSVAELAMASAKSREVKEAVLVVLNERYAVASLAARIYDSATCRVYRAEDLDDGAMVAVKLFADATHYENEVAVRKAFGGGACAAGARTGGDGVFSFMYRYILRES